MNPTARNSMTKHTYRYSLCTSFPISNTVSSSAKSIEKFIEAVIKVSAGLMDPIFVIGTGNFPLYEDRRDWRWKLIIYQFRKGGEVLPLIEKFMHITQFVSYDRHLRLALLANREGIARETSEWGKRESSKPEAITIYACQFIIHPLLFIAGKVPQAQVDLPSC